MASVALDVGFEYLVRYSLMSREAIAGLQSQTLAARQSAPARRDVTARS